MSPSRRDDLFFAPVVLILGVMALIKGDEPGDFIMAFLLIPLGLLWMALNISLIRDERAMEKRDAEQPSGWWRQ